MYDVSGKVIYFVKNGVIYLKGFIDGMLQIIDSPVLPYGFVRRDYVDKAKKIVGTQNIEETEFRDERGHKVYKYMADDPRKIAVYRDKIGYDVTYEADIPYTRRLMIDYILNPKYDKSVVYVDIELNDKNGFPREYGETEIISIAYSFGDNTEWMYIGDYNEEADMIEDFYSILRENRKTVMLGWNVGFDYGHLLKRAEKLELKHVHEYFGFMNTIDIYDEYKTNVKGLSRYTLLEVARHEGFEVGAKERTKMIHEMSREELEEYNKNDVDLLRLIDQKYGFSKLKTAIAETVGLTLDNLTPLRMGDNLILRRARELGYVLKNTVRTKKKEKYDGAVVLEPTEKGLIKNVAVFDVESMYPNIIISRKIDIGEFRGEILPAILTRLLEERKQYKILYKQLGMEEYYIKQYVYKILANSLYGLLGAAGFRYFDIRKAARVTEEGRKTLLGIKSFVETNTRAKVVYGDTDSTFIQVDKLDSKLLDNLAQQINSYIKPLRVKLEYMGDMIIFARKRYVFRTVDGKYIVKGIELIRSDWDDLTKKIVSDVIKMIFDGKEKSDIMQYLADIRTRMFRGEFDEMLINSRGIDKTKTYKVNAEHVRAYKKLLERGFDVTDRILYIYYANDVEPLVTEADIEKYRGRLDYRRYWSRITGVVKRYTEIFNERNQSKIMTFMGA